MMEKYITDERTGLKYELVGDYYLIAGDDEPEEDRPIGVWGQRHLRYTDKKRPQALSQRTLEFYLVEKEQFPEIRKLLKLWMWAAKPCGTQRKRSWLEESRSSRIEDIGRTIQAAGIYLRFSKRYPS